MHARATRVGNHASFHLSCCSTGTSLSIAARARSDVMESGRQLVLLLLHVARAGGPDGHLTNTSLSRLSSETHQPRVARHGGPQSTDWCTSCASQCGTAALCAPPCTRLACNQLRSGPASHGPPPRTNAEPLWCLGTVPRPPAVLLPAFCVPACVRCTAMTIQSRQVLLHKVPHTHSANDCRAGGQAQAHLAGRGLRV